MPKKTRLKKDGSDDALQELKSLYAFMREQGLESLELDRKDYHVRLVRQGRPTAPVPVIAVAEAGSARQAPAASAPAAMPANAEAVRSPMAGIFYRAASPSSPSFVKEGDAVKPGNVLCIIEAMKVFNDIKAECHGKILRICVENGKPVKAGQELFHIEKQ
ncbi:MAG: acetyl-CoA carboxylase biotin carboxyl carrier protein [Elusimicrobiota bacterium]|jgi:acetyl-CoA carboxylase biotin carboxyl carrier protein